MKVNGKIKEGIVKENRFISEYSFIQKVSFEFENEWYIPIEYLDSVYFESLPVEEQHFLYKIEQYILHKNPFEFDPGAQLEDYIKNEHFIFCNEWLKEVYKTEYIKNNMDTNVEFVYIAVHFGESAYKEYSRFENLNSIEVREYVQAELIDWMKCDIATDWEEGGEEYWDEINFRTFVK